MRYALSAVLCIALLQGCGGGERSAGGAGGSSGSSSSSGSSGSTSSSGGVTPPPVAKPSSSTLSEDSSAAITLLVSGSGPFTYTVLSNPSLGTLTGSAPNLRYTPNANANGDDSFTYQASNSAGTSAPATVTLHIKPVNDRPSADSASLSTGQNTPVAFTATGSDVDGDALSFRVGRAPGHGTLTGTAPNFSYTPARDYVGQDSFTYLASDGRLDASPAVVSVQITGPGVARPPTAQNGTALVSEDSSVALSLSASGDGPYTYALLSQPSMGVLTGALPNLSYAPNPNVNGSDSFTFKVSNAAGDSAPATFNLRINPVNDRPTASSSSVSTPQDQPIAITLQASDIDGDTLSYRFGRTLRHGSLSGTAPNYSYTPEAGYTGNDDFTFIASDGRADASPATVSITITGIANAPVAGSQSLNTPEDTARSITLAARDPNGKPLSYQIIASPTHGTLSGSPPALTYTPAANYSGSDSFKFNANNGSQTGNTGTISLSISAVNDVPSASNLTVAASEDAPVGFTLMGSDVEGDALSYDILVQPAHGGLSPNGPGGAARSYLPDANFNGSDTFTYVVRDGQSTSPPATVTLKVAPVNDAPTASNQSFSVVAGATTQLLLQGQDIDGDTLSYTLGSPSQGRLRGTGPEVFYTAPSSPGTAQFTYVVNDASSTSGSATVTLTITAEPVITGRALNGPLANATVKITPISTQSGGSASTIALAPNQQQGGSMVSNVYSTLTSDGDLTQAGYFSVPVSEIDADSADIGAYLITVSGGQSLDANSDGIADASATANLGTLSAIVPRSRLKQGGFTVNALSTALAERARMALQRELFTDTLARMSADAKLMLGSDLNSDGVVDYLDGYVFDASQHLNTLRRPKTSFNAFQQGLLAGSHDVMDSHRLLAPQLNPQTLNNNSALVVRGTLAYTSSFGEFSVLDISQPEAIRLVGHIENPVLDALPGKALVVIGDQAVVTTSQGLMAINIANSAQPVFNPSPIVAGNFAPNGVLRGNVYYLSNGNSGQLEAYDLGNVQAPTLLGSYSFTSTSCNDSVQANGYAFFACNNGVMEVVDIRDPAAMTTVSATQIANGFLRVIAISGTQVAVVQSGLNSTVTVADVSNPSAPTVLGTVRANNLRTVRALSLLNGYGYLGGSDNRVFTFDLRTPGAYTLLGSYRTLGTTVFAMQPMGNQLLVAENASLSTYDLQTPTTDFAPVQGLGALLSQDLQHIASLPGSAALKGQVFLAGFPSTIIDTNTSSQYSVSSQAYSISVSVQPSYATYAETGNDPSTGAEVQQLRVTPLGASGGDANTLENATVLPISNAILAVDSLGDLTVVAEGNNLTLVSTPASNPASAAVLRSIALAQTPTAVRQFVQGGVRYAAVLMARGSGSDFLLVNLDNSATVAAIQVGDDRPYGFCSKVLELDLARADGGRYAYVGCGRQGGLATIDLAQLSAPKVVARLATARLFFDALVLPAGQFLAARNQAYDLLLLPERGAGLRVVDISQPLQPRTLEVIETFSSAESAAILSLNPLRIASGERLGVVPLAAPYYPVP